MTTRLGARVAAALVWGLGACAPASSVGAGPQGTSQASPSSAAPAAATTAGSQPTARPSPLPRGPFTALHGALRELERRRLGRHARIVWLGDSHAQADFWTGGVRRALQRRFGNAGPGFVHLGMKSYRHDNVDLEVQGGWRMRPKQPSTIDKVDDGRFGLGGVTHTGFSGPRLATVTLDDAEHDARRVGWDLCVKATGERDRFVLSLGAGNEEISPKRGADGALAHLLRETSGRHRLSVRVVAGAPEFCGVYASTDPSEHPGVLVDTLGINGARYATALAWDEAAWAAELGRRPTDLVVLEYGGNEASDGTLRPETYRKNAVDLVARVRRAAPDAGCLVIGPADRADRETAIPPIVNALRHAADQAGCAFWDTWSKMGGRGSLARWRDDKKAAPDGIHLLPRGYAELGALLVEDLLAGYSRD